MLRFTDQDVKSRLKGKAVIRQWIYKVLKDRGYSAGEINIVLCSDEYLLNINKTSLGHDYYTDIITFDYCEGNIVSGDLFISLDTVLANSRTYRQMFSPAFKCELLRVIIHGILHLSGEDDITSGQQKKMRRAENICLKTLLSDFDTEKISVNYKA
ncbi:MAG: rRNA maturation RNase YbeY [Bacteroidales bacterium]|nr:rRNA maturation RNase YbeY [Bacteroidales bacterium]